MDYKIEILYDMVNRMEEDPYTLAKLRCGDSKVLNIGISAIEALIFHYKKTTDCGVCLDSSMCDQVRYNCPKWSG